MMMKKLALAASVLVLLALFASAASAGVTINGKPLDEVDDIMAETGAAREYPKQSLLIFRMNKEKSEYEGRIVALNSSGDVYATYSTSSQPHPAYRIPNWNGGLYPVSTVSRTDCRRRVWVPTAISSMMEIPGFSFEGPVTSADWYGLSAIKPGDDSVKDDAKVAVTDVKAGFFPAGSNQEVIVVGRSKNINTGSACADLVFFADGGDGKTSLTPLTPDIQDFKARDFYDHSPFPSCRVAVGDFDGDGRADEVAMLYNNDGGKDKPYYIRVYKVSRDGNYLTGYQLGGDGDKGRLSSKANFHYRTEASALLAGDFDGDGKDELALVASDKDDYVINDPNRSYISVEIFKWNGSGWDRGYKSADTDKHYQLANGGQDKEWRTWGFQAAAGDLDGDGKDEIVTLAIHGQDYNRGMLFLSAWSCEKGSVKPNPLGYFDVDQAYLDNMEQRDESENSDAAYWEQRLLSLAVGPFTGQVQGINSVCDVAFSMAGPKSPTDHGNASKQRVWVAKTVLENGTFRGFGTPVMVFSDDVEGTVGLTAADFAAETLRLGTPEHVKVEGHKNYTVILRVPPYHVDWIQAPWSSTAPTGPTNFSWMGRTVQYEASEQEGSEYAVTSKVQNCLEAGLKFKYDTDINVGIKLSSKSATGLASIGGDYGFSVGFDAGITLTKETANKNAETHALSTQLKATTADALMYDAADYHIWRYPVEQPAPAWMTDGFRENESANLEKDADGNVFVTYTLCDEATQHICDSGSDQYDSYGPSYEEGNLFSYPNKIFFAEDEQPQKELSSETSFTLTTDTQQTLSFTKSGSSSEKDSTSCKLKATGDLHGSINGGADIKVVSGKTKYSLNLYGQYGLEAGEGTTSTKTWSSSEKIVIGANTDNLKDIPRDYVQFTTESQVFVDAAGVLTTPFGVTFGKNAWLWNYNYKEASQSPYVVKPDPALVLPGRYRQEKKRSDAGVVYTAWQAVSDESAATRIRGMTFYDMVTQQYVSGALEQGWKYKISFPIYNASFVAVPDDGVVVALYHQKRDGSDRKEIGRQTVPLKGWTDDITNGGSNKATVEFEWSANIKEGDYEFYVVLDPDNAIPEVHETWTKDTRDGNNNGYCPFAVVNTADENGTVSLAAADEKVSAGDFTLSFWDLNDAEQKMMTPLEFRSYVLAQSGDIHAGGQATYNGAPGVTNAEVELLCTGLAGGVSRVIFSRRFPVLRPGVTREFTFKAIPEKLAQGNLVVRFSSSRGSFTVGENRSGSSNSGGCNALWGAGLGGLALAVISLLYIKEGRKQ